MASPRQGNDPYLDIALRYLPDMTLARLRVQSTIPALAKDGIAMANLRHALSEVSTQHRLVLGDARDLSMLDDESVHLVVTSPPYWTLKKYNDGPAQLGDVEDYDEFCQELDRVWRHVYRLLAPGGRLVIVVGDVCLSRRQYGRHVVFPLHSTIQEHCRQIGFDNLAPIIWHKIANAKYEAGGGGFLGKPYEPNAVIKNDIEYILLERKPGGYRKPTMGMRTLSILSVEEHREMFQQIWTIPGASTKTHPAPYPIALAERLVRMFSFVGDTVLDPFSGTGSTMLACLNSGRNSVNIEVDPEYLELSIGNFMAAQKITQDAHLLVEQQHEEPVAVA